MNKKLLISAAIIGLVGLGVYLYIRNRNKAEKREPEDLAAETNVTVVTE